MNCKNQATLDHAHEGLTDSPEEVKYFRARIQNTGLTFSLIGLLLVVFTGSLSGAMAGMVFANIGMMLATIGSVPQNKSTP